MQQLTYRCTFEFYVNRLNRLEMMILTCHVQIHQLMVKYSSVPHKDMKRCLNLAKFYSFTFFLLLYAIFFKYQHQSLFSQNLLLLLEMQHSNFTMNENRLYIITTRQDIFSPLKQDVILSTCKCFHDNSHIRFYKISAMVIQSTEID